MDQKSTSPTLPDRESLWDNSDDDEEEKAITRDSMRDDQPPSLDDIISDYEDDIDRVETNITHIKDVVEMLKRILDVLKLPVINKEAKQRAQDLILSEREKISDVHELLGDIRHMWISELIKTRDQKRLKLVGDELKNF